MGTKKPLKAKKINNEARSNGWALLWTVVLIAAALSIIYLSSYFLPRVQFIEDLRNGVMMPSQSGFESGEEIGSYAGLRFLLSMVNIILVIYLLYVYVKDYVRYKSGFAFGLVAFLFSFLLYAFSSLPLVHSFLGFRGLSSVFAFIPLLFSAVGLVIFAKLSSE